MNEHYCRIGWITELDLADPRQGFKAIGRFMAQNITGIYVRDFKIVRRRETIAIDVEVLADPDIYDHYLDRTNHGVLSCGIPDLRKTIDHSIVSISHPLPLARLFHDPYPFDYEFFRNINPNCLMEDAVHELGLLGMGKVAEHGANNMVFGPALDWDGSVIEDRVNPGLVGLYCLSPILPNAPHNAPQNPFLYSTRRQAEDNHTLFKHGKVTYPQGRVTLGQFVSLYDLTQHEAQLKECRRIFRTEVTLRKLRELQEMHRSGEIEVIHEKAQLERLTQSQQNPATYPTNSEQILDSLPY